MNLEAASRRVIVHAGLPKTATTTIQNALFDARHALHKDGGVLFPGGRRLYQQSLRTAFREDPRSHPYNRMRGRTNLEALRREAESFLAELEDDIQKSSASTVLLSCEGISQLKEDELTRVRDWLRPMFGTIEVLFVTREPVSLATSVIQQILKQGAVLEHSYARPQVPHFELNIGRAIAVFGRDAIRVRALENMTRHPDGVVAAFLDEIGVSNEGARRAVLAAARNDNVSFTNEAAQILSSLNRQQPLFVEGSKKPVRRLNAEVRWLRKLKGEKFSLPLAVAREIFEASRNDVAWLKENFGIEGYETFDERRYTTTPPLAPEFVDSLALLLLDLVSRRRFGVGAVRGHEGLVRRAIKSLHFRLGEVLPRFRRWYR